MTDALGTPIKRNHKATDLTPQAQFESGQRAAKRVAPGRLAEARLAAAKDRDVVDYIRATHADRLDELMPLRIERMSEGPFAFFRGTAGLMTADLAAGVNSGLTALLCGDAHANNFGLYGAEDGDIVMDINDFDEAIIGPWEWDLKRLVVSMVLAAREAGASDKHAQAAARDAVKAYKKMVRALTKVPYLKSFTFAADAELLSEHEELGKQFRDATEKARRNVSEKVVNKSVEKIDLHETGVAAERFIDEPPILFHVKQSETEAVKRGVRDYLDTLHESRRPLLERYRMLDVAFRVVGTGSVGMRSYIVLLAGNDDDYLVLQVKQAGASALAPFLPDAANPEEHDGRRIVRGAQVVQARSDHLLGWTEIDGRPFIVRQFRNAKGSVDPLDLHGTVLDEFAEVCGALLARAHCRTLNPHKLAGYLSDSHGLAKGLRDYAVAYADQVEADYATFLTAAEAGEFDL